MASSYSPAEIGDKVEYQYPRSSCQMHLIVPGSKPCSSPAHWKVSRDMDFPYTVCYGHGNARALVLAGFEKEDLPEMFAHQCYSGDTWVTCEKHKGAYAMFSSKAPKKIRTAIPCEICSSNSDYDA